MCRSGGKLISCDACSNFYHIECIEPPIIRAPRGRWSCTDCKDKKDKRSSTKHGKVLKILYKYLEVHWQQKTQ